MQSLEQEIKALSDGTDEEVGFILSKLKSKNLNKGDFLLQEGNVCRQYFFIDKGAVRLFYYKNLQDFTVWIGTPGQIFTDLESYLPETPSRINMQAIEPSVAYYISKEESDKLAKELNAYNSLLRRTVEIAFVNLSKNVISFQSDNAVERYQRINLEKNWLSKYPLKYISSFIGITQSSLSKIRSKRI